MLTGLLNRLHNAHEAAGPHDQKKADDAIQAWLDHQIKKAKLEVIVAIRRHQFIKAKLKLEKAKRDEFKKTRRLVLANASDDFKIANAGEWRPSETLEGIRVIPVHKSNRDLLEKFYLKPATAKLKKKLEELP